MAKRISVVVSQGQSQNPQKRQLEEDLVASLMMEPGIDVTVIPHLYDLHPDGTGTLALTGIPGDMIVASWLFERAARWTLDRNGIRGQEGICTINTSDDDDEFDEDSEPDATEESDDDDKDRVADARTIPSRKIYCMELAARTSADDFLEEVRRIAREATTQVVQLGDMLGGLSDASATGKVSPEAMERFQNPTNDTALGSDMKPISLDGPAGDATLNRVEESAGRRWYPVIDFSRCTNCMECIDFCLFGVYGVDGVDTILVEQPDNCRKGCPACSRVCPENAIIFPQHKTPAIAGAPADV
ncbi:MAG: ferredoxin family protein, partial [Planctomycetota bacterium]